MKEEGDDDGGALNEPFVEPWPGRPGAADVKPEALAGAVGTLPANPIAGALPALNEGEPLDGTAAEPLLNGGFFVERLPFDPDGMELEFAFEKSTTGLLTLPEIREGMDGRLKLPETLSLPELPGLVNDESTGFENPELTGLPIAESVGLPKPDAGVRDGLRRLLSKFDLGDWNEELGAWLELELGRLAKGGVEFPLGRVETLGGGVLAVNDG